VDKLVNRSPLLYLYGTVKVRDICSSHIGSTIIPERLIIVEISHSYALGKFKKEIGQANHMLITILVGLDGVITSDFDIAPEFRASWNPKSKITSAERSKLYAKKTSLSWLVNCLEMYLKLIVREPSLIEDCTLHEEYSNDKNSRSVYNRIKLLCEYFEISSIDYALVDLLICWRNSIMHFDVKNVPTNSNRKRLTENANEIAKTHCGLDIVCTLNSFDKNQQPSFKEVTSFVRSSINLVYEIDRHLVQSLDTSRYTDRTIMNYLKERDDRFENIFSKDQATILSKLRQILKNNHFTDTSDENDVDIVCNRISKLNHSEAKACYIANSFL